MKRHKNVFREAAAILGIPRGEFERRMLAIVRRMELYQRVHRGEAKFRRVWVEPYEVPSYEVQGHYRYIEDRSSSRRRPRRSRSAQRPQLTIIRGGRS